MNYCNVVWGRCGKGHTDRIFKLQKRILRMIYDDYVSNIDFLLKRAGTLSVYQRIDYDTVILVFKCIYGNVPMYLSNMFIERPQTSYSLRNNNSLEVPKPRTIHFKRCFSYAGAIAWNSLPEDVRMWQDINSFKYACKVYYKSNDTNRS